MQCDKTTTLKFAVTRDLTLADVVALRDALNIKGYKTTLLNRTEGGIDFSESSKVRKDLRFDNSLSGIGIWDGQLAVDTLEFVGPMDKIVKSHASASPPFSTQNELRAYLAYDFLESESLDVVECMVQCFGVLPDTIHNRGQWSNSDITTSDNATDVNLYLGFDLASAVSRWTVPREEWPDALLERLFECWACKARRPWFVFLHARADHRQKHPHQGETTFYGLLELFEHGQSVCCDNCHFDLTHRATSKRRRDE